MAQVLFRRAQKKDAIKIHELAEKSGIGMTTLPKDLALLKKRLNLAFSAFKQKSIQYPHDEYYLFVLEDLDNDKIVGTAALEAATGLHSPFYSYKISKRKRVSHSLNIHSEYDTLNLVNDYQGHTELCTLFLDPDYRVNHNGILLSRARLLFIANYPHRFSSVVFAEIRGVSDPQGESPFWNHLGRHFFHMSFSEADRLTLATNKQFISDLMPRGTIYVPLLNPEAQAVIGKPHPAALPAMNILLKEGFYYNHYVDIFDAGPTIEGTRDKLRTVYESELVSIECSREEMNDPKYIIANTSLNFRAIITPALIDSEEQRCIISEKSAALLQLKPKDQARIIPLKFNELKSKKKDMNEYFYCRK